MKRRTCVRHRDGWCATVHPSKRYRDSVKTICGYWVTLPYGLKQRMPDCEECLALMRRKK